MAKAKNGYFIPFSDGDGILISAPTPWCRCRLLVSGGPRRLTNCQARGAETGARMGLAGNGRNFYPPPSFPFDGKSFHVNAVKLPFPDILGGITQDDAGGDSGTGDVFTKGPLATNCNIRRS
ncbi:hypothetical protein F5144DRAFT_593376 [Chaetomium tenue]|uniref:Uncharacterized protein n=1 Tax=Chaetomium tenue TaxID=1854479 RepID=A0ACB7P9J4_9PEZI|nr:hypothetical protein F5144DRAFT_593376 [Chaetomium globosum]